MKLDSQQKRDLISGIFPMKDIDRKRKFGLLEKSLGKDKTDMSMKTRMYCKTALPDAEEKKQAWAELFNKNSKLS